MLLLFSVFEETVYLKICWADLHRIFRIGRQMDGELGITNLAFVLRQVVIRGNQFWDESSFVAQATRHGDWR